MCISLSEKETPDNREDRWRGYDLAPEEAVSASFMLFN